MPAKAVPSLPYLRFHVQQEIFDGLFQTKDF